MKELEVIVTQDAENDLTEILDYISFVLLVPKVAIGYLAELREEMSKLSYRGASIAPVSQEPWHSRGIKKIPVENFYIYFRLDDDEKKVYVLNVVYAKRDQLDALKSMKTGAPGTSDAKLDASEKSTS